MLLDPDVTLIMSALFIHRNLLFNYGKSPNNLSGMWKWNTHVLSNIAWPTNIQGESPLEV